MSTRDEPAEAGARPQAALPRLAAGSLVIVYTKTDPNLASDERLNRPDGVTLQECPHQKHGPSNPAVCSPTCQHRVPHGKLPPLRAVSRRGGSSGSSSITSVPSSASKANVYGPFLTAVSARHAPGTALRFLLSMGNLPKPRRQYAAPLVFSTLPLRGHKTKTLPKDLGVILQQGYDVPGRQEPAH